MDRRRFLTCAVALGAAPDVFARDTSEGGEWIRVIDVGQERVRLIVRGASALSADALTTYVRDCVKGVASYYGRFPTPISEVQLTVHDRGTGWGHGRCFGGRLPRVKIGMGAASTLSDLQRGWVFVHELVHLACPMLAEPHEWFEEGLSTYVEPWVRVPMGELSPAKAWGDLVRGLPQGQPRSGDQGLDRTGTWGRTYWGGALFHLMADVQMRRRDPSQGMQQAFQGLIAAGGGMHQRRDMVDLMDELDAVVGGTTCRDLWRAHRHTPVQIDLEALWAGLGVVSDAGRIRLVDAPEAHIRQAICPQ